MLVMNTTVQNLWKILRKQYSRSISLYSWLILKLSMAHSCNEYHNWTSIVPLDIRGRFLKACSSFLCLPRDGTSTGVDCIIEIMKLWKFFSRLIILESDVHAWQTRSKVKSLQKMMEIIILFLQHLPLSCWGRVGWRVYWSYRAWTFLGPHKSK